MSVMSVIPAIAFRGVEVFQPLFLSAGQVNLVLWRDIDVSDDSATPRHEQFLSVPVTIRSSDSLQAARRKLTSMIKHRSDRLIFARPDDALSHF